MVPCDLLPGSTIWVMIICDLIRIIRVIEVHNKDAFVLVITINVYEVLVKIDDMSSLFLEG